MLALFRRSPPTIDRKSDADPSGIVSGRLDKVSWCDMMSAALRASLRSVVAIFIDQRERFRHDRLEIDCVNESGGQLTAMETQM